MAIRILVADDHALFRAGIRKLLQSFAGVEVVGEAGDGHEALRLSAAQRPDVLLMDIAMPELNGVEDYVRRAGAEPSPLDRLTPRQREILQLIAEGNTTKAIATKLGLSVKTVETHRAQLMERLEARDIAALVRLAIRLGLVAAEQ